jgi:hypothetical protein
MLDIVTLLVCQPEIQGWFALWCGGGVPAAEAFVALHAAGVQIARVYHDSWAEGEPAACAKVAARQRLTGQQRLAGPHAAVLRSLWPLLACIAALAGSAAVGDGIGW